MNGGPVVMVAGSRTWEDYAAVYDRLAAMNPKPKLVLHGGAQGADRHAERACSRLGIKTYSLLPRYSVHGPKAPLRRTDALLDEAPDLVLAFWDGRSPGTGYTIREAEKRGIPVEVVHG